MKNYSIVVTLPELPAAHAQWSVETKASSLHSALSKALTQVERLPAVKGRHITEARIAVQIRKEEKR